jgi:hypothetical protein
MKQVKKALRMAKEEKVIKKDGLEKVVTPVKTGGQGVVTHP